MVTESNNMQEAEEIHIDTFKDIVGVFIGEKKRRRELGAAVRNKEVFYFNLTDFETESTGALDYLIDNPTECMQAIIEEAILCAGADEKTEISVMLSDFPEERKMTIGKVINDDTLWKKLVCISGLIENVSAVKPSVTVLRAECPKCGTKIEKSLGMGEELNKTMKCPDPDCKGNIYIDTGRDKKHDKMPTQYIIISESYTFASNPQKMPVWLTGKFVDTPDIEKRKLISGSNVEVIGIIYDSKIKKSISFNRYIEAYGWSTDTEIIKITEDDENTFREMAKDKLLLDKLVECVAPSIYGYTNVKEAILLMLIGGNQFMKVDGTLNRGRLHMLLLGDPASAKTQFALWVNANMPKSQYATGRGTSGPGLSAAVKQDAETGYWVIEPGKLVLSHDSVCIVDEMDKMREEDITPLDEVMESQTLTISKAAHGKFKTWTSVLGVANPIMGRYDRDMEPMDQVNIKAPTLSRFDLKFLFLDEPDKERDGKIFDFMYDAKNLTQPIEPKIFIKYVIFASRQIVERGENARSAMKEFVLGLRDSYKDTKTFSITHRQSGSLMRMAEAYAKLRLGRKTTADDAKRACDMMMESIKTFGMDPKTGIIDIDKMETGISKEKKSKVTKFIDIFAGLEKDGKGEVKFEELKKACIETGFSEAEAEKIYDKLKLQGMYWEPNPGMIKKA